jgi:glycosyltransferase involved in cell wall biosynthesis
VYHGGFHLWECRTSFARADLALFLNPYELGYAVSRLGVPPARAALVRNGIAAELLARLPNLPPSSGLAPRNVAFVGTYLPRKGIDTLRKAMIGALHSMPQMRLGFFGTRLEPATILADYPQALHDRITVVPHYANADLSGLLADFHILAFPSLSEGYPLAVGEAMACGLVPVVSAVPGPADIVLDGSNGLVVPPADPAALQAALERLIREPEVWRRLRDAAVADAGQADWQRIAEETLALFSRHAGSGSAAGPPGIVRPAAPPVTLDLPASVCDRIAQHRAMQARSATAAIA